MSSSPSFLSQWNEQFATRTKERWNKGEKKKTFFLHKATRNIRNYIRKSRMICVHARKKLEGDAQKLNMCKIVTLNYVIRRQRTGEHST